MIKRIDTIGIALVALLLATSGCGGPATPPPGSEPLGSDVVRETSSQAAAEDTSDNAAEALPPEQTPAVPATAEPTPAAAVATADEVASESTTQEIAPFNPPYPDRIDLFQPTQNEQNSRPAVGDDMSSNGIRLLGFVGVNPRCAVFTYNGDVQTVAAGSEIGGVEVMGLNENEVSLRRGRVQWTLSLLKD